MINISPLFNEYLLLNLKEINKVVRTSLMKAANTLKKNTQRLLVYRLPKATERNKYDDTLVGGVMRSKYDRKNSSVKVHVMGIRNSRSGTFRLRFFEGGTKERVTKKGYRRGRITALNFFKDATSETNVDGVIEEELSKAIRKINNSTI